jgi:hypothetical protein
VGNWDLKGIIGNRPVANNFSAQWVLNHQFIELNLIDTVKIPTYTAKVFIGYDCVSERYIVHWIDNFGGRFSEILGYGQQKGNSIEFRFEYADGPFINKFIYNNKKDTWQLNMTTKNERGKWVLFGDEFLIRKINCHKSSRWPAFTQ